MQYNKHCLGSYKKTNLIKIIGGHLATRNWDNDCFSQEFVIYDTSYRMQQLVVYGTQHIFKMQRSEVYNIQHSLLWPWVFKVQHSVQTAADWNMQQHNSQNIAVWNMYHIVQLIYLIQLSDCSIDTCAVNKCVSFRFVLGLIRIS